MQLLKLAAIALVILAQSGLAAAVPKAKATPTPATNNSCLQALGALGAAPNPAIRVVDASKLSKPSDLRSLRKKAKDGLPIIIKGGDFSGKKFGGDDFSNLCFDGTRLVGTRWSKSRADGVAFINADLTGALFDRVSLRGVLFRNSVLARMDASGANLAYGQLDGGWDPSIAGLRLENAQMTGFRFACGASSADGCSFDRKQISLRGANLTNANLANFALWDANLVDVILNNSEVAFDQLTQYADANVHGPLIVHAGGKKSILTPEAFRKAVVTLGVPAKPDTECSNPATPLSQIFCRTGQTALRAYRDDVDRLYQLAAARSRPDGAIITVVAPTKEQDRYLASLRKCALRDESRAIACISDKMKKRRAALVALAMKNSPLEADGRALFVSVETPLLQSLPRDGGLASLTPLLVGSAPTYLLAYRDDDNSLNARGVAQGADGMRCVYAFAPVAAKPARKKKAMGANFAAWYSGAEFAVQPVRQVKRKAKKTRKGKRAQQQAANIPAVEPVAVKAGCSPVVNSGPLIRVPLSEQDFDILWTENRLTS